MSRAGLAATRGSTGTFHRSTEAQNTDGTYDDGWADVVTGVSLTVEPITSEIAQNIWGQETKATWRGVAPDGTDLKARDGLTLTAGKHSGKKFRVVEILPRNRSMGTAHIEIGLEETTEDFA